MRLLLPGNYLRFRDSALFRAQMEATLIALAKQFIRDEELLELALKV